MKYLAFIASFLCSTISFAQEKQPNAADEVSDHYTALPNQYNFDKVKKENLSDKITRQYIMGAQSMIVKWTLKKGAVIAKHMHENEQTIWITQGSVKVISQGKEFIVTAGNILVIPAYVPHELYALEDTIDIDFFSPVRADWLTTTQPAYILK
jgi:quercetin dioxygenase-like cupin family protein